MRIAIYPGTFDPITNGHLDIVKRASRLFDKTIVAVANNLQKHPLFSLEERRYLVEKTVASLKNVEVDVFDELLVRYAKRKGASALIRGLRAVSDFEYEFQLALMNRKLMPELETVYLMPSEEYTYINSTIAKEVVRFGGRVDCFLPPVVAEALKKKMKTIENKEENL
ncbi:MAG: pantetheine-phosphate adenylyltransferase [Candidatus Neomarinimicrobiota bacterium]|nr:MAG: pantetheine-phosphate adenylyltransferase [Candidatus Neomarinimicrobiota bacterium]